MRYFTEDEMQKLQNADKDVLRQNYNNMSIDQQNQFKNIYQNTLNKQKFWVPSWDLTWAKGYNENQVWMPWVNLIWQQKQNQNINNNPNPNINNQDQTVTQNPNPEIKGLNAVRYKDEPTWNLDMNLENFQNIYRKQRRWEKLWLAEQNFLSDLDFKTKMEWKTMQELFWIETRADKERKYQNLAMENRNLSAWDLRDNLARKGLNYDEIEKVVWYHQPYNEYLQNQREIKARSDEAYRKKEELLNKQFESTMSQIQENWRQRMNTLNSSLSFSGFGRSSHAIERRDEITKSVNSEISMAQSKMQAELALYQAQLQWADAETLSALSKNVSEYTNALKNQQTANAKLAQQLNDEANISMKQALENMIALSWINPKEVDVKASEMLWYAADKYWNPLLIDSNGNPIKTRSAIDKEQEMAYKMAELWYKQNKDERDFNYWMYKDDRELWLKENELWYKQAKDERDHNFNVAKYNSDYNLENQKFRYQIAKDERDYGLKRDELDYKKSKDILDMELKKAEKRWEISENFVKWNQALFDDMRKDMATFTEINRQYNSLKTTWENYKNWDKSNKWVAEQHIITAFNKILDPGSVVREWEFARTAEWQAILDSTYQKLQSLAQGGSWVTDKTLEDIFKTVERIYNTDKKIAINKKENYKANATYLWAQPEFVDNWFNRELWLMYNEWYTTTNKAWEADDAKQATNKVLNIYKNKNFPR